MKVAPSLPDIVRESWCSNGGIESFDAHEILSRVASLSIKLTPGSLHLLLGFASVTEVRSEHAKAFFGHFSGEVRPTDKPVVLKTGLRFVIAVLRHSDASGCGGVSGVGPMGQVTQPQNALGAKKP